MFARVKLLFVLSVSLFFFQGCGLLAPIFGPVYQTTSSHVDQGKDQGYIRFTNTTSHHRVFVDGVLVGSGDAYGPEKLLGVPPGTHLVEIMENGSVIVKQKVFIGTGSTRTIEIR